MTDIHGDSHTADFRTGVDTGGDDIQTDARLLTCHMGHCAAPLGRGRMGQLDASGNIPNGIYAGNAGFMIPIRHDTAAFHCHILDVLAAFL